MRRRTVLLIAPSAQGLHLTRRALEEASAHHTVQVVRDGEAALEYLLQQGASADPRCAAPPPDVIVLDLPLPRLSGPEVLRLLKQDPRLHSVPIIVLAPSRRAEDVYQAYTAGANAYVCKPAGIARFLDVIEQLGTFWLETVELPPPCALEAREGRGVIAPT
jgi:CheY-like chemotaxis protein